MKTLLKYIVLAPIGLALIALALANRGPVRLGFDPFANNSASPTIEVPIYVAMFSAVISGVLIGGIASWISQGRHRRAARLARAENAQLRSQLLDRPR